MTILDDVGMLSKLPKDELDEILLDPKYNKANLRQLLRISLAEMANYEKAWRYERGEREKAEEKLENLKEKINDMF